MFPRTHKSGLLAPVVVTNASVRSSLDLSLPSPLHLRSKLAVVSSSMPGILTLLPRQILTFAPNFEPPVFVATATAGTAFVSTITCTEAAAGLPLKLAWLGLGLGLGVGVGVGVRVGLGL